MALSEVEKSEIIYYCGWTQLFSQYDYVMTTSLQALETKPTALIRIQNPLNADPPGLLATLKDIDAKIVDALSRLQAVAVGSIQLHAAGEIAMLRSIGRQHVARLCAVIGVNRRTDVFSPAAVAHQASASGPVYSATASNYIGK